ncbi:MAG: sulfurtransferase TusA family protein [Sphaerochaetaceae bacterium]|nr:sulfurtransferase TusA family protein [Sphaerochaetaceae bacterium]
MKEIDARGLLCPQPVVLTKKEADKGTNEFCVLVDNRAALENVTRFGNFACYNVTQEELGNNEYKLTFKK